MEADGYWREVVTSWYFTDDTPAVGGAVIKLLPRPRRDDPPGLRIQTKAGEVYDVYAYQARLVWLLKQLKPAVGDRVLITYIGEAEKAPPGMRKAKEFTVEIRRQGTQSSERTDTGTSGKVKVSDNASGTGAT